MSIEDKIKYYEEMEKWRPKHVYSALRELEVKKKEAYNIARYYERIFYKPLINVLTKRFKKM